jgi:hypothetical protein
LSLAQEQTNTGAFLRKQLAKAEGKV